MVKIRGPVLSQAASGTIGKIATYSTAKGRAYMKFKPTPAQPRSGLQVSTRAMMTFLTKQWSTLTTPQQSSWDAAYPATDLNRYNSFLRHNLKRWRTQHPPTKAYPATEENDEGADLRLALVGGVRHVKIETWVTMSANDNWTMLLFHSAIASPDADLDKLIHIFRLEDTDHHYWTHSPLPAGTHYYRVVPTTDDGNVNWADSGALSAVAT